MITTPIHFIFCTICCFWWSISLTTEGLKQHLVHLVEVRFLQAPAPIDVFEDPSRLVGRGASETAIMVFGHDKTTSGAYLKSWQALGFALFVVFEEYNVTFPDNMEKQHFVQTAQGRSIILLLYKRTIYSLRATLNVA